MKTEIIKADGGFILALVNPGNERIYYTRTLNGKNRYSISSTDAKIFKEKRNAETKSFDLSTDF